MILSTVRIGANVSFPEFTGERVYMLPFMQNVGLPTALKRWQPTVDAMLKGIESPGPIYLMIDQGIVRAGNTHRRPGLHVDGNWVAGDMQRHTHQHRPSHHHPEPKPPEGGHRHRPRHTHSGYMPEAVILASDVGACRAVVGSFNGHPSNDGCCDHIDVTRGKEIIFDPYRAYVGNVTMLHESLPVTEDCFRTLVRLNVPGVTIN